MPEQKQEKSQLKYFFEASMVGVHLVVSTVVGFFIGYGLDYLIGVTKPYLTFIFLILGIVAGFRDVFRTAKKLLERTDGEDGKKDN